MTGPASAEFLFLRFEVVARRFERFPPVRMRRPRKLFRDSRERKLDRVDLRPAPGFLRGRSGGTALFPTLVPRRLFLGGEILFAPAPAARHAGYPAGGRGLFPDGPG